MTRGGIHQGLLASFAVHALAGGVIWVAMSFARLPPIVDEIPIVIVSADEISDIDRVPEPEAAIQDPVVEVEEPEPEPPVEEEIAEDLPEPEPPVEEEIAEELPEPEPEEKPRPEEKVELPPHPKPKPTPPKRPEPEPPREEPKDLASSLKDLLKDRLKQEQDRKNTAAKVPQRAVAGPKLTAREETLIRGRMARCWTFDTGTKYPERLWVELVVQFRRDGSVASVQPKDRLQMAANAFYRRAVENAVRAVYKCAPYSELSPRRYESWKALTFGFDPSKGLGF